MLETPANETLFQDWVPGHGGVNGVLDGRGRSGPVSVRRRRAGAAHIHVANCGRGAHRPEHKEMGCQLADL